MNRFRQVFKKLLGISSKYETIEVGVSVPSFSSNGQSSKAVYVGCEGDTELVRILTKNQDYISTRLGEAGCKVIFYPTQKEESANDNDSWAKLLAYYHPEWRGDEPFISEQLARLGAHDFYRSIRSHYEIENENNAYLLWISHGDCKTFPIRLDENLVGQINYSLGQIREAAERLNVISDVSYYSVQDDSSAHNEPYNSDAAFTTEASMVSRQVADQLETLFKTAEDETLLQVYSTFLKRASIHRPDLLQKFRKMDKSLTPVALSRLVVDKHGNIFLPDFNNLEIKMTPLPKTLYLFFLKHPKGMMFHDLVDHRKELLNIYGRITNSSSTSDIRKRIDDLVDIRSNSINEKCSRIKEAFIKEMHDSVAGYYYINGGRGASKKISLPGELIQISPEFR